MNLDFDLITPIDGEGGAMHVSCDGEGNCEAIDMMTLNPIHSFLTSEVEYEDHQEGFCVVVSIKGLEGKFIPSKALEEVF